MANELDEVKVGTIATRSPFTVRADMPVSKAAERMLREKVHNLVVTDKDNKAVGVISAWDVLKIAFLSESGRELPVSKLIEGQKMVFVYTEVTLRDALDLMINKNIRALPVLDEKDNLYGKISLTDIAVFVRDKM